MLDFGCGMVVAGKRTTSDPRSATPGPWEIAQRGDESRDSCRSAESQADGSRSRRHRLSSIQSRRKCAVRERPLWR